MELTIPSISNRAGVEAEVRLKVKIRGVVQGVGFRPFIYRLANELKLAGWVVNSAQGVIIEVEGERSRLGEFLLRIEAEKPPQAVIQSLESSFLDSAGYQTFTIRHSEDAGEKTVTVLPDIAACPDCLREIFNPDDRRYLYPFTNCTNCGPRYSIIESLPYDRANTSMKNFRMCPTCQAEYEDPSNRRFHAQPNACPECGPQLELWDKQGKLIDSRHQSLLTAAEAVIRGEIVAVKGLGGFHLMVDALDDDAVARLRSFKAREEKPFALMFPSLEMIKQYCQVSPWEERLLLSPECPIVLLKRLASSHQEAATIAVSAAPGNPYLGVMLPYTPLHHILMRQLGLPVVATSGNIKDEPICIDENEALHRLAGVAELFLIHNRPIVRHVDDSIVRVILGSEMVIRRARGYAPLPVASAKSSKTIIALGGHLKNTIAFANAGDIFLSQHIGDLETAEAYNAFKRVIESFKTLYQAEPEIAVCDMHPDYLSRKYAVKSGLRVIEVQHHYAHILACMAENELEATLLGVAWDGTGYGTDGAVWGGEFLQLDDSGFTRTAHFRNFTLPGGEKAVREPRRTALGLLYEICGDSLFSMDLKILSAFSTSELKNLSIMLKQGINTPATSSAGRLFDAAAAILGLKYINNYEGQAAMELEFAADDIDTEEFYPFEVRKEEDKFIIDWENTIRGVIDDMSNGIPLQYIVRKFHNTMAEMILDIALKVNLKKVVLSGGCFQNGILTELTVGKLQKAGFAPYWHQRVPPNDGGIALGQVIAAIHNLKEEV